MVDCGGSDIFIFYCAFDGGTSWGRIEGITIQNCSSAIVADWRASAYVGNCIIRNSSSYALKATGSAGSGYGHIYAHDCIISSAATYALFCDYKCSMNITRSLLVGNARVAYVLERSSLKMTECTVVANGGSGPLIAGYTYSGNGYADISRCIFAFNSHVVAGEYVTFELECCDIYGNTGGDYVGPISGMEGVNGNFSADPQFCNLANSDFTLGDCSPCLPGNHPYSYSCGRIGALDVGCVCNSATEPSTWGGVKAVYR